MKSSVLYYKEEHYQHLRGRYIVVLVVNYGISNTVFLEIP